MVECRLKRLPVVEVTRASRENAIHTACQTLGDHPVTTVSYGLTSPCRTLHRAGFAGISRFATLLLQQGGSSSCGPFVLCIRSRQWPLVLKVLEVLDVLGIGVKE